VHKRYIQEGENYRGKETQVYGTSRKPSGERNRQAYKHPKMSNPGNLISCKVGGGHLGSGLAHQSEAPFPESLAEFVIKSFCPPNGVVLDPFLGSGTTAAVTKKTGRKFIGIDIRKSQIKLSKLRLTIVGKEMREKTKK